jgi:hypothetical protein
MLTKKEIIFLRKELATARNPLFFHDGDGDGLAAFLLLYKIHREGRSVALTSTSILDEKFMRKVDELNPDKIFILDIPVVTQEFLDKAGRPVFWIDHHPPLKREKVHYFNPRLRNPDIYIPVARLAYQISENGNDLWIAAAGCFADWYMPDFLNQFIRKYPKYLKKKEDLPTIVFKRPVSRLVKLLNFLQKGPSNEVRKSIKILTRINSPDEIFEQQTPAGRFLYKRFIRIDKMYCLLLKQARKSVTRSKLILFYYTEKQWSFTASLANELSAFYPKKVIIIARRKSGWMKCSLRGKNIAGHLAKALADISGSGGGHPDACGAVIKEEDWEMFLQSLKEKLREELLKREKKK